MKIVQGDELDWVRGLEHRGGTFHFRNLMEGEPGTIDNFQLSMGRNDKDFVSPRHRHNFDQIRVQIDGDLDFARDGKMTAGTVGFFPEGAHYGPQTTQTHSTTFVLQFGGAILNAATLDFIGLGPTNAMSLGLMMQYAVLWGALQLGMWWWFIPPGLAITAIVGALYSMNVGLDEVFNPKLREM